MNPHWGALAVLPHAGMHTNGPKQHSRTRDESPSGIEALGYTQNMPADL